MSRPRRGGGFGHDARRWAVLAGLTLLAAWPLSARAQAPKPRYLPYVEFPAGETEPQVAARRGYNEAIQRYNQSLYEYHVVLERHDGLVDLHNRPSSTPDERQHARAEASALRGRLDNLAREAQARAAAVDQTARQAVQVGVALPRTP